MALIKSIELPNGVTIKYHRIVRINNIINHENIIEIAGYTTKSKRDDEKTALKNNNNMNVFIDTDYVHVPYDENMNVVSAYEYLKTTEKYGGAKNA